ncbi:MAG: hypothetical protein OXU69_06160 [Gemmatimonadota bacterium]|nr:hypothetical protein [Gemmatimonadota bacterium]MDE2984270.1 hypothetical protein [Gemmatimonadota bacterium]
MAAFLLVLSVLEFGVPQEVVNLPVADDPLCTGFDELFRVSGTLTTVSSIGFDRFGTVRIGDAMGAGAFRVVGVTAAGDRFEFGRLGQGPGEFAGATRFVALANGHSVVPDYERGVFHEFEPNGRFRHQARMDDLSDDALDMIYRADRSGGILGQYRAMRVRSEQDTSARTTTRRTVEGPRDVVRVNVEGVLARVSPFASGWTPPRLAFTHDYTMGGLGTGSLTTEGAASRVAFLPRLLWDVLPGGGIAMSDSSGYAIKILDGSGQVVRILRRALPRQPITAGFQRAYRARELDALEAEMTEMRQRAGNQLALVEDVLSSQEAMQEAAIATMEFADEVPLVDDLLTAWDGTIWIRRMPESGFPADGSANPGGHNLHRVLQTNQMNKPAAAIDLLNPGGQYLGTIPATQARWPAAMGPDGLVAFVEVDEFDVPVVLVGTISVSACEPTATN